MITIKIDGANIRMTEKMLAGAHVYAGKCPDCGAKLFIYYPESKKYHCFDCGKNGILEERTD